MREITRREFLKQSALALTWLALPSLARSGLGWPYQEPPASLGRISTWVRQAIRTEPLPDAELVAWKSYDEIVPIYASVISKGPWPTNPIWYRTDGGFIHSGYVQPVEDTPAQEIVETVEDGGFWAQVCVPIAEARFRPDSTHVSRKLYYGTVYRVAAVAEDAQGNKWYQLREGFSYTPSSYVLATSLRRIPPELLAPFSYRPSDAVIRALQADMRRRPYKLAEADEAMDALAARAPEKWIEINLAEQFLTCFEDGRAVFTTRISSGISGMPTPRGEFRVLYKRHTQRMVGPDFDLPGVSFPTYFTPSGVAIHGTYWHNDYGRPHSHGCVNVTNEAARWIFRWTDPPVPYSLHTLLVPPNEGTRVVVY